jgi:hypothetical protein
MDTTPLPTRRAVNAGLLALIAAVALAACGSSSSSHRSGSGATTSAASTGGGANSAAFAKFQSCLKSHGVTLPKRGGRGFRGGPPAGGARGTKQRAAFQACGKDLPKGAHFGGGRPGAAGAPGRFSAATLTKFGACVKQHGFTLPKANTSGQGSVFPRSVEHDAAFQKAAKVCQSDLRPSGAPPGGSS